MYDVVGARLELDRKIERQTNRQRARQMKLRYTEFLGTTRLWAVERACVCVIEKLVRKNRRPGWKI